MKTIKEFKEYLKDTAKEIRNLKSQRKTSTYGYVYGLDTLRNRFRLEHIAYCIFRGTPIEKIEHDTSFIKDNKYYIDSIMSQLTWTINVEV